VGCVLCKVCEGCRLGPAKVRKMKMTVTEKSEPEMLETSFTILMTSQVRQRGKKIETRVSRLINFVESIRSYVDQSPSNINGVYEMIFKQRLFTILLGLLLTTVLTDQASALYDPGVGLFCSRDPIGYEDGPSQYEYSDFNPATYSDPLGLLATLQGTGPEITSIDNNPCATCCCCPVFIQVNLGESGRKLDANGKPEFHMGKPVYQSNIHYTITMMYKPAPGNSFSR